MGNCRSAAEKIRNEEWGIPLEHRLKQHQNHFKLDRSAIEKYEVEKQLFKVHLGSTVAIEVLTAATGSLLCDTLLHSDAPAVEFVFDKPIMNEDMLGLWLRGDPFKPETAKSHGFHCKYPTPKLFIESILTGDAGEIVASSKDMSEDIEYMDKLYTEIDCLDKFCLDNLSPTKLINRPTVIKILAFLRSHHEPVFKQLIVMSRQRSEGYRTKKFRVVISLACVSMFFVLGLIDPFIRGMNHPFIQDKWDTVAGIFVITMLLIAIIISFSLNFWFSSNKVGAK